MKRVYVDICIKRAGVFWESTLKVGQLEISSARASGSRDAAVQESIKRFDETVDMTRKISDSTAGFFVELSEHPEFARKLDEIIEKRKEDQNAQADRGNDQ